MALTEAWEQLETHFGSPYQPSQQLIHDILHGPSIPLNDHKALAAFAQKCSAAEKLQAHDPISMTYHPTKDSPRGYPTGNNQERPYKPAYKDREETPPPSPRTSN